MKRFFAQTYLWLLLAMLYAPIVIIAIFFGFHFVNLYKKFIDRFLKKAYNNAVRNY